MVLDLLTILDFILLDEEGDDDATDARDEDAEVAQANMLFICVCVWSFLFLLKTRAQIDIIRHASL